MGDIIRSVLVLGLGVIVLFGIGQLIYGRDPETKAPVVDYAPAASSARAVADFPLLAPDALPKGWQASSARFQQGDRGGWHLGVLTSDDEYIGLEQFKRTEAELIDDFAKGSKDVGAATIAGREWRERTGGKNPRTFVTTLDNTAVLVTGTASRAQVVDYIESLDDGPDPSPAD